MYKCLSDQLRTLNLSASLHQVAKLVTGHYHKLSTHTYMYIDTRAESNTTNRKYVLNRFGGVC